MKMPVNRARWMMKAFFLLMFFGVLGGCLENYGALRSNPLLLGQYQGKELPDTYNYYYCGRSSLPYAVVGIDKTVKFSERFWFKITTKEAVYKKIANLSDIDIDAGRLFTSDILDPQGQKIGVWFSFYSHTPVKVDPETRTVNVYNPYKPSDLHSRF